MRKWTDEEIRRVRNSCWALDLVSAADHIREMQDAVEQLRTRFGSPSSQQQIDEVFWPKEETMETTKIDPQTRPFVVHLCIKCGKAVTDYEGYKCPDCSRKEEKDAPVEVDTPRGINDLIAERIIKLSIRGRYAVMAEIMRQEHLEAEEDRLYEAKLRHFMGEGE